MWFTVVRLIYRKVSHHDCFRVQVIGLCTSVMLSGHWPHPPPNLFILPNESSLPMKQRPPTLSSPQQHLISTLFTKDCKKPICFCEWLITIWRPQVRPGCMRILFPVMTLQHGRTTFCLPVNGYLSSSYSFPPRNCHTILPSGHTPTVQFYHIVQVSSLSHSAHILKFFFLGFLFVFSVSWAFETMSWTSNLGLSSQLSPTISSMNLYGSHLKDNIITSIFWFWWYFGFTSV